MKTNQNLFKELTKLLPTLKQNYFVASLGVFGSQARQDATPSSDIDILVSFSKPVGFEFFELKDYLESHLHKHVDLVTQDALKARLKPFVMKEVVYID